MATTTTQAAPRGTVVSVGGRKSVIDAAETAQLCTDSCKLALVSIWGDTAGTACLVTVYDDPDSDNSPVWRWATAQGLGTHALQFPMQNGLRVVVGGTLPTNGGITVVYEE